MRRSALLLVPLLVLLLAGGAFARGFGQSGQMGSTPGQAQIIPGHPDRMMTEDVVVYTGRLTGLKADSNEIVVRTQVPGILGQQTADSPFKIDQNTTMTICFKSINSCSSHAIGTDGLKLLQGLEGFDKLALSPKDVIIVGDPSSNRIIHVEVDYGA